MREVPVRTRVVVGVVLLASEWLVPRAQAQGFEFIRGDSNASGVVDISDSVFTLGCLFSGGACPQCADAADANDDGKADISDAVYGLNHLFGGGAPPPPPYPAPGFDGTPTDENVCGDPPVSGAPGAIVISELLYHPVSENIDDEFIEIYNRSSRAVQLEGYRFSQGVSFTFPQYLLGKGEYLVIARVPDRIKSAYGITNVIGGYGGSLDDGGEEVRIKDPAGNTVTEVDYDDGGLWPRSADGYGSSLELIDLHGNEDSPAAWGPSDETVKSQWRTFSITANATTSSSELHLLLLSEGECLLDNLEVLVGGQARLANGSFESGLSGWLAQGTHRTSFATTESAVNGTRALHLVSTGRGDTATNRIERDLSAAVSPGQSVTIRGSARWLSGARFLLVRLHGNAVARSIELEVPEDGGTPGRPNTLAVSNRGPDITGVTHFPVLPSGSQTVRISAEVEDVDAVGDVSLRYHVEPSTTDLTLAMRDDGTGGDAFAGDGTYTATIPRQTSGKMVGFWIQATDGLGAEARFPPGAPRTTALYRVGESNPNLPVDRYHIWMPQSTVAALANAPKMSNEMFDITFVLNNTDVFYNARIRYRGSPFIRSFPPTDPVGGRYAYRIDFGEHQKLYGESEINLDNLEQGRDPTLQREVTAYRLCKEIGLPYSEMVYVRLYFNGNDHGIYADVQKIDKSYVSQHFPDDQGGNLHKIDDYFEFQDDLSFGNRDARLTNYGSNKEEYRWNFEKRDTDRNDDFIEIQRLAQRMNVSPGAPNYESTVEQTIDPEEWVRALAVRRIIGDWDSFGYSRGKNMYLYRPPLEGRWKLLEWDMDFLLGNGAGPSEPLFGGLDPAVNAFLDYPKYKKLYLKAFRDLVDGPFRNEFMDPLMDATFNLLQASGGAQSPSAIKSFIAQRRAFLLTQLPSDTLVILTNNGADFSTSASSVTIEGDAPLEVESFRLNGSPLSVTITGISRWSFSRSIPLGTTQFTVEGFDGANTLVGSDSISVLRVVPCVPTSLSPSHGAGTVQVTVTGTGFQMGTTPVVRLLSASVDPGFNAFYAQSGSSFGDIDSAEAFLNNPGGATKVTTTHLTVSRRTEGGGELFPTTPFPAPWNTGSVSNFAARYTGFIHAPSAGPRTLGVNSDDGFRLRVNGIVVADWPPPRGPAVTTGTYTFPAEGSYPIELTWYENGGGDIVQLFQEAAGGSRALLNGGSELVVTLDDPIIIPGTSVSVTSTTSLTATFNLSGAPPGVWALQIVPAQGDPCTLNGAFTVD